ncbi:MAG: ATP-binding protein [Alistipes sp.]|nr:ATP-binding protein [Alistipes sp.]
MSKNINIGFTVDAGLIQRLGYELVGRAETAVSELIKNAYDADASVVDVEFINTTEPRGTLIITDNGAGMSQEQLLNGFMRISSTDKIHNPISAKYHRAKAGRKGIGRFATQRLGEKLTIITQTLNDDMALRLSIDWNQYEADRDITAITFPLVSVEKERNEGTTLIIDNLREGWSNAAINRVYRYIIELFQPDYLSDKSQRNNYAKQDENLFKAIFRYTTDGITTIVNDENISIFTKSLAVINGYIDSNHIGQISVISDSLGINDNFSIYYDKDQLSYSNLSDIHFKIYYFIYNRPEYYGGKISNIELRNINELSKTASGVRLYRNGFRVLPYGEPTNDWTQIDRRWSSESGSTNVPLSNKNLFGFVEISDPNGNEFEETASREGLIENEAFRQLTDFVHKALVKSKERFSEKIALLKESKNEDDYTQNSQEDEQSEHSIIREVEYLINNPCSEHENKKRYVLRKINKLIEEAGMLRVLAGLGLTIGEFTHEIKQYKPAIYGEIDTLKNNITSPDTLTSVNLLKQYCEELFSYTRFFSATISQNTNREKAPIDILEVVDTFQNTIANDLGFNNITFDTDEYNFDVYTIPMHKSEWSSILFNLYSNSRKAIRRARTAGRILLEIGNIDSNYVFVRFNDNGDGIPEQNRERVFNAFFSTSMPASFDAPQNEQLTGTGLGLKIVKDIITSYKGTIKVVEPTAGFSTCIEIRIPKNK